MKKIQLLTILFLGIGLSACNHGRHVTIVSNTNGRYTKLEYAGDIYISENATSIKSIAPGGYVKYETNDESIIAERNNDGDIVYQLNGGNKQLTLNNEGKELIATAVGQIKKHPDTHH